MGKLPIRTVSPKRTFEIRNTPLNSTSWLSSSSSKTVESQRILSVFEVNEDASQQEELIYYIDTAVNSVVPIWPFNSTQVISIFSPKSNLEEIRNRKATALETNTQSHSIGYAFLPTVGTIRFESSLASENATEKTSGSAVVESRCYSGLGMGRWSHSILEEVLDLPPFDPKGYSELEVEWRGLGEDWETRLHSKYHDVIWEPRGGVSGGGLILTGQNEVHAVYKPRSAQWMKRQCGSNVNSYGEKVGVLGVCHEGLSSEWIRHLLLSVVAIEEQIMRAKGFKPLSYHGCWD